MNSPQPVTPTSTALPTESRPLLHELIPGPKILLMGDSGTAKTTALQTLEECGITVFVIATEQNFLQVMKQKLGKSVHYKFIAARPEQSWGQILDMAKKINALSYENLCKVHDPFKQANNKFLDLIVACNDFKCDCCNKSWGQVNTWGTDRAFVIDSFSGASDMAFALVIGNKPVRDRPDYQVAQNALRMILDPLTSQLQCMFVLITHLDRVKDDVTGGTTISVSTIGQALGPDLPRMFSDVIRARRNGKIFYWDTADSQATVVARHIPIDGNLPPSFKPLIDKWKALGGQITETKA